MTDTPTFDPLIDEEPSRYVVGIDLGTTNSAVTYIDSEEDPWKIRVLSIPQLVAPGEIESLDTLPSFYFQPAQTGEPNQLKWHGTKSPPDFALAAMPAMKPRELPGVASLRQSRGCAIPASIGPQPCCHGTARPM